MKLKKIQPPRNWRQLKAHPFADLIEFGVGIDLEALAAHMQQNGYQESEPVILFDGKVLDGRHRIDAAQKAEVEPTFKEFSGDESEALEYVRKKILRQHLDTSQRAMIAAKVAQICADKNATNQAKTQQAAAQLNVGSRSVDFAKTVNEKCSAAIQRAVRVGNVSVSDAASIASMSHKNQDKALERFNLGKGPTLKKCAPSERKPPKPRAKLTDAIGNELPDSCRDAFADDTLKNLIAEVEQAEACLTAESWTKKAGKLTAHYPYLLLDKFHEHTYEALHRVQVALVALRAALPYAICPKCNGTPANDKPCRGCRNCGHVPEERYKELTA